MKIFSISRPKKEQDRAVFCLIVTVLIFMKAELMKLQFKLCARKKYADVILSPRNILKRWKGHMWKISRRLYRPCVNLYKLSENSGKMLQIHTMYAIALGNEESAIDNFVIRWRWICIKRGTRYGLSDLNYGAVKCTIGDGERERETRTNSSDRNIEHARFAVSLIEE